MRKLSSKNALTLLELIIAMSIFAIIIGISTLYLKGSLDLWGKGAAVSGLDEEARLALEWLSRDIHDAWSIEYADAQAINITKFDGAQPPQIRYYLDTNTSTLMRMDLLTGAEEPLLKDISNFSFAYRSDTGAIDPPPLDDKNKLKSIKFIIISLRTTRNNSTSDLRITLKTDRLFNFFRVKNINLDRGYDHFQGDALSDPDLALSGHTLQSLASKFCENITVTKGVKFEGGYNEDFATLSGTYTIINGNMTFEAPGSEIKGFMIE